MATSQILTAFLTPLVFKDSTGDAVITLNNLAAATGRISARYDRGAGSLATRAIIRATFQKGVAGVVNEAIIVYIATSDGTHPDAEVGTVDAALTAATAVNLKLNFPVIVPFTTTNTDFSGSAIIEIPTRYFSVGVMNSTTGLLRASANTSLITVTFLADESQ